ncbi:MAG TPA: VWA domain-containing protein [Bryobacteraceae bacterium]|nr:VWA domain-containing protein [Bryobacteraceae bacterium]
MVRIAQLLAFAFAGAAFLGAAPQEADVVFHSDVSLVRIDAQVVDSSNRSITHLNVEDFVLRANGQVVPIRNFASENMPVDVLFLLDVSASMRPHVQRIADASGQALTVLGKDDRMGIMVFDRSTRVRLSFNSSRPEVQRGFDRLLREERFNGGTDITRAMLDAADYIRREGRRDARRAIVILTDDETEFNRDDQGVGRALARADAVMCALIAPDAGQYGGYPRGGGGQRRGTWGSGGGQGGGLPGVIFGPRGGGGMGGGRYPGGGGMGGPHTQSAGTAEIARESGGDSMSVNDASALEETLARLRQRYTLYFNLPDGVKPGDERNIEVALTASAARRHTDAEVRYRRVSQGSGSGGDVSPVRVTRAPADAGYSTPSVSSSNSDTSSTRRHRVAVNQDGSAISGPASDNDSSPAPAKPSPSTTPPKQQ